MSESAFADSHSNRRESIRHPVQRAAELMPRGSGAHQPCTILDESEGGVLVETENAAALPEEMVIKFSDSASQLVRRCWANGVRAGYQFIEIVPVRRHRPQQEQAAAALDVLALNNFVAVARSLLNLFVTAPERLHSMQDVSALLSQIPYAMVAALPADNRPASQLFSVPEAANRP